MSDVIWTNNIADFRLAILDAAANNKTAGLEPGVYNVDETIEYVAPSSGNSCTLLGAHRAGRGPAGVVLRWAGESGGTIMNLRGANSVSVKGFAFDPYTGGGIGALFVEEMNSSGGAGSSGVTIDQCHVQCGVGAGSFGIRLGDNQYQVSEVYIGRDVTISGGPGCFAGILTNSGNTKNFHVAARSISGCDYAITHGEPPSGSGSGYMLIDGVAFSNQRLADVWGQSGTILAIRGGGSEGSARLFSSAGASGGPHVVSIEDFYFDSAAVPSDDGVIVIDGQLSIKGCSFRNNRVAGAEARIIMPAGSLTVGKNSVTSRGSYYKNSRKYFPVYDTSGSSVFAPQNSNYVGKNVHVDSRGDVGDSAAGGTIHLTPVSGAAVQSHRTSLMESSDGVVGCTYKTRGEGENPRHMMTLTYQSLTAASSLQTRQLWTVPPKSRIVELVAEVRVPFAGPNGQYTVSLGTSTAANEFLKSFDAETASVRGLVASDFGAGWVAPGPCSWTLGTPIKIRFAGSGNLGTGSTSLLTAGEIDIYVVTQVIA